MRFLAMAALVLMVALVGCSHGVEAPPPAQDVGTPVETAVARALPTATPTATPPPTATPISTPTPIPVPTATPAPTPTPTPVPTAIPTPTPKPSPTPTPAPPTLPSTYETDNTRWLARNYPALARQIHMLPWVQDGLSDLERSAVDELLYIAVEDVANLDAALGLPWVQDDIRQVEYELLDFLGVLDNLNPANLLAALDMAWVQDGAGSAYITNNTRWLARNYPALFHQIHTLPWVQDGLSDLERSAVDELLYIAVEDVANLDAALGLPWVQDDIRQVEYELLDFLGVLDNLNPANLLAALDMAWVQDGAGSAYITNNTRWLARNYPSAVPSNPHATMGSGWAFRPRAFSRG